MTESSAVLAWPAARGRTPRVISHPAWEEARNAILDRVAQGPVTIVLIGAPGTGKTWLLRELAASFGDHGFPTTVLMQGDLPAAVAGGAALLVDETLRMPHATLDELLQQDCGVAVLADVERFADIVESRPADPVVIRLRPLTESEVLDFAAQWLQRAGLPATTLEPAALPRLVAHAGGIVRLIAQLLTAAVAMRPSADHRISAADIDAVSVMRGGGLAEEPAEHRADTVTTQDASPEAPADPPSPVPETNPAPPSRSEPRRGAALRHPSNRPNRRPNRRPTRRALLATSAIAACIALGWTAGDRLSRTDAPPAITVAALPPLRPAVLPAPALAQPGPPSQITPLEAAPLEAAPVEAAPLQATPVETGRLAAAPPSVAAASPATMAAAPPAALPAAEPAASAAAPPAELAVTAPPPPALAPPLDTAAAAVPVLAPPSTRLLAEAPEARPAPSVPEPAHLSAATVVATLGAAAADPAPPWASRRAGAPGMVLIAQRGDTLQSMYHDIYRDREAPPYQEVAAVNPRPLRPGAFVVFPSPPGGWSPIQR